MNAYDFDNTIYNGESIVDFFLFCISKDLKLLIYLPAAVNLLRKYKKNKLDIVVLEKYIEKFMTRVIDVEKYEVYIEEFWKKNKHKLKPEFLDMIKKDDIIITGCPSFLFDYIRHMINTDNILCSEFDLKTKDLKYVCLGKNKVDLLNKYYPNVKIKKFYTDSMMDTPMMKISEEVYFVDKNEIKQIK